jgi:arylsulfatase A-like enzyme
MIFGRSHLFPMLRIASVISVLIVSCSLLHAAEPTKPNVLLIIADDMGYSDHGFCGNSRVHTPAIDQLASESAVFRNFVVAAACSPTRAALFTGRDHLLTGVWGVPPRANVRVDEKFMPAYFHEQGYATWHGGKGDTVKRGKEQPWELGWDDAVMHGYQHENPAMVSRTGSEQSKGWAVDLITDRAVEFIREHGSKPWFASIAYVIPHLPWHCPQSFSQPYRDAGLSADVAECYGSITQMDAAIGRLLESLGSQRARTVVVFLSDNGMSHNADVGRELSPEDSLVRNPDRLRGHKATVWENGIRVPLLVSMPGTVIPAERSQFAMVEDVLPTLLDLSGIPAIAPLPLSGISLAPVLRDPSATLEHRHALRMAISGPGAPAGAKGKVQNKALPRHHVTLRGPRWKYHHRPGNVEELYDIRADPQETQDVSAAHPKVLETMRQETAQRWETLLTSGRAFAAP